MTIENTIKEQIDRLRQDSIKDFNELYAQYADPLYSFAFRLTRSEQEAKDIVQETFLRIWNNRKFISSDYSFKSYIYTIAHNLIIDAFKRQLQNITYEEYIASSDFDLLAANNPEDDLQLNETLQQIQKCKQKMTPLEVAIFEMNREKGLSTKDISEKMNIPQQTIKNKLTHILKLIKEELKNTKIFLF